MSALGEARHRGKRQETQRLVIEKLVGRPCCGKWESHAKTIIGWNVWGKEEGTAGGFKSTCGGGTPATKGSRDLEAKAKIHRRTTEDHLLQRDVKRAVKRKGNEGEHLRLRKARRLGSNISGKARERTGI